MQAGAAALIDLGGADVYGRQGTRRSCGVNGGAAFGAGFLLDLAGDDLYRAGVDVTCRGQACQIGSFGVNGGGAFGAGFLLDAAGDDTYQAGVRATLESPCGNLTLVTQQFVAMPCDIGSRGTNGGGFLGAGALLDLAGNDTYQAGNDAACLATTTGMCDVGADGVNGGAAKFYLDGVGSLLDLAGDDEYVVGRNATCTASDLCNVASWGVNGGGATGPGLLFDRAGTDWYDDQGDATGTDKTVVPKSFTGAQVDYPHLPGEDPPEPPAETTPAPDPEPHVIVGIPDTGLNPYHDVFSRPNRTDHPCTYIDHFPCDIPALNLSLDIDDYDAAVKADRAVWENVEPGRWYWIPGTVFVAVSCFDPGDQCILGSGHHGTGGASSIITEAPDALIAYKHGGPSNRPFHDRGIPVDVFSSAWSNFVDTPAPAGTCEDVYDWTRNEPILVRSAGNEKGTTLDECEKADPGVISVGGAYAEDRTHETDSSKQPEVVSYYCRPLALGNSTSAMGTPLCGTSFSAPTVAGSLAKVILGIRRHTGYTGSLQDNAVDPVANVTIGDLRDALNRTASYDPTPRYNTTGDPTDLPLNPVAPWLQWGWGFYDGWVANATLDHLLGTEEAPPKSDAARRYMEAQFLVKETVYG